MTMKLVMRNILFIVIKTNYSNLIWKSKNNVNINKETADKLFKLLEILEDNDDVQGVSSNFEVDENVMSSLTS